VTNPSVIVDGLCDHRLPLPCAHRRKDSRRQALNACPVEPPVRPEEGDRMLGLDMLSPPGLSTSAQSLP
jgi:hypothetical protein